MDEEDEVKDERGRTKEKEKTIRRKANAGENEAVVEEKSRREPEREEDREEIGTGGGVITDCSP